MWRRIAKVARSLPVLIAAGLFGLYLLFGFFLVDPLAQKLLPWAGEKYLASRLNAERVAFNPLTLELRVQGLALAEPDGAPLAGFAGLYANLDVEGLTRWAWHLRSVELDQPHARVEIRKGGTLNWAALLARLEGPPSDSLVRLLIDRLEVKEGDIQYVDAEHPGEPFRAALKPLGIELQGLSTLPEDRAGYLIAAKLPELGGTLRWKGDIAVNPLASQGEISLEGARVDKLLRAVAIPLAAEARGTLGAALHYRFAMLRSPQQADLPSLQVSGGKLQLQDFSLVPRGSGEPLLQMAQARVDDVAFDWIRREFTAASLRLEGGRLAATRDARGALDWDSLLVAAAPGSASASAPARAAAPAPASASAIASARPAARAAAAPAGKPWKFAVPDIRVSGWSARWTDRTYTRALGAAAEGLELSAALTGEVGASTALELGPVRAAIGPVQITSAGEPVAQLQRTTLTNARLALPALRISADALDLSGARTQVVLDKRQQLNWAAILQKAAATSAAAATPAPASANASPDLKISRISLDDIQLRLVDASPTAPVTLDIAQGKLLLQEPSLDLQRALPIEASFVVKQGGRMEAKGSIVPGQPSGQFDVRLARLSLKPFAPYVNQFAHLFLHSGAAGTRGKLQFGPGKAGMALAYTGGFAVDDLAITEEETGEAFLGWERLSTDSLRLTLAPDRLRINELVARSPFGRVIIFEDQTLNLTRIQRAVRGQPAAVPVSATATSSTQPAGFPVAIERLRLVGGNMEFADLSLTPQFGTRIHDLSGVVSGLSTDPAASAQVELDGKVDEFGSARIRGSIQPFRATDATDLTLAFRNLEMTQLTPYAGKFAGRKIESGKLSVDLEYKIKQRQLAGTNKFVLNKVKLGERVDSPSAMKLPLDLAIALLQDSNGVIDVDLPVSGSLDDPHFSYGALIWKAIVNVLTKIVTAPFRALGSLLGANAEKFEAAGFDPGSSALLPPEQEKLKVLADAMAKRPALTVTIEPGYDPQADRRALQEAAMRRDTANVAGHKLAPDEAPGPVDVNNYKIQTWLEDSYEKRAGKDDYQKLRASYRSKDAGAVTRVMDSEVVERLGRRFKTRDEGAPSAFHQELLERLTRQVPVADEALVTLAQARGRALREQMLKLGLDEGRVAVAAPGPRPLKEKMVGSGLALGARELPRPAASAGN